MIPVVCAIIADGGKILIVRHGPISHHPGKWEFPGGKIDGEEDARQALIREIWEELSLEVEPAIPLYPVTDDSGNKTIRLIPFLCQKPEGDPSLNEHAELRWISPEDAGGYDLLAADRYILANEENMREIIRFLACSP